MSCALSTRTAYLNIIISLKDYTLERIENLKIKLNEYCNERFNLFAFILHDKDLLDDNSPKTNHIHLIGIYKNNRQRLSTILNDLSVHLSISEMAISIDKMNDINGSMQYLLHRNNPQKYQYDIGAIMSNLQIEELNTYMQRESNTLSTSGLLDIIRNSQSKIEVYESIGLEYYRQYRQVINDLWFEIHEKATLFACSQFEEGK